MKRRRTSLLSHPSVIFRYALRICENLQLNKFVECCNYSTLSGAVSPGDMRVCAEGALRRGHQPEAAARPPESDDLPEVIPSVISEGTAEGTALYYVFFD